jgi:hypothetical protein
MKGLRASSTLQDVAVDGINVGDEHAPEHALKSRCPEEDLKDLC